MKQLRGIACAALLSFPISPLGAQTNEECRALLGGMRDLFETEAEARTAAIELAILLETEPLTDEARAVIQRAVERFIPAPSGQQGLAMVVATGLCEGS